MSVGWIEMSFSHRMDKPTAGNTQTEVLAPGHYPSGLCQVAFGPEGS